MSERATVIEVEHVNKSFGSVNALTDLSFKVEEGEMFGLLGPNGAGKTTCIRILLDIFQADGGTVRVFGSAMTEQKKDRIGYLPEERGLYQDVPLERCLIYLATLKGLSRSEARRRVGSYLERFELSDFARKKVKELSKGMQQKAQIINTLVHEPDLVIIDEPFTALDPVNTQMVKEILRHEQQQGRTIIMCTHQMHQVEELCDRILLVDHGRALLYGGVREIRQRFAGSEVYLKTGTPLHASLPGVAEMKAVNGAVLLKLSPDMTSQQLLQYLLQHDIGVEHFEISMPSLDDIFIRVVGKNGAVAE